MYKWSACGRAASEAALALIWPWLGEVKRDQARAAIDEVDRQYAEGRYLRRADRGRPSFVAHPAGAAGDAGSVDFAWAAGFLDAEGYFGVARSYERVDGSVGSVVRVSVTQHGHPNVPAAVLTKLQRALGVGRIECHGAIDDFKWVAEGTVNVGQVLEETRAWLGPVKTQQAESAIDAALSGRVRGDADRCKREHLYDRIYVRPNGAIHRICNSCDRMNEKAKRAAAGSQPRQLRHAPEDPTRMYVR